MIDRNRQAQLLLFEKYGTSLLDSLRAVNRTEVALLVVKNETYDIICSPWGEDFNKKYGPYTMEDER